MLTQKIPVCQIIGPAAAGSAGPVPTPVACYAVKMMSQK